MDIFGILTLIGGLALFLYGMDVMGAGLEKVSGGKLRADTGEINFQSAQRSAVRSRSNCCYSVIFSNYRNGSWFCKLRNYETFPGNWYYHGCQYRYNGNILALKSDRNR